MRGQTTLDFAIGVTIFLSAMVFTFAFAPGILTPFTESGQDDTVTVDRIANHVGQDLLGGPERPYVLDRRCTVEFFRTSGNENGCRWEDEPLHDQLGVSEISNVNVTISGNLSASTDGSNRLWWDDSSYELVEADSSVGDVPLSKGNSPPERNAASVSATRVATLHGKDVTIRVVMWG